MDAAELESIRNIAGQDPYVAKLLAYVDELRGVNWGDREDQHSEAISAAHPVHTGEHKTYATALEMVGNRRSKYALVDLVNWLLADLAKHREIADAADAYRKAGGGANWMQAEELDRRLKAAGY